MFRQTLSLVGLADNSADPAQAIGGSARIGDDTAGQ